MAAPDWGPDRRDRWGARSAFRSGEAADAAKGAAPQFDPNMRNPADHVQQRRRRRARGGINFVLSRGALAGGRFTIWRDVRSRTVASPFGVAPRQGRAVTARRQGPLRFSFAVDKVTDLSHV